MTETEQLKATLEELRSEHRAILSHLQSEQRKTLEIARSAWRVQEEERGRLARELHDGLGQSLTALKNDLTRLLDAPDDCDWRERVSRALAVCAECLEDTRSISRMLRPALLDDLGLESALRQLCRSLEAEGLETELIGFDQAAELDKELGTLIFRLVQEACTNAVKHARAATLVIRLITEPGRVVLLVMDDGRGFDPSDRDLVARGFGLRAMSERVQLFRGRIDIESHAGEGTQVRATIPIPGKEEQS